MADFFGCGATQILVADGIFDDLALRVWLRLENVVERLPRGGALLASRRFRFLLLLVGFALFLLACGC